MMRIHCPWCWIRDEPEFVCRRQTALLPRALKCEDAAWGAYLYLRKNPKGAHHEIWKHSYGCGQWFSVIRNTVTREVLAAFRMNESAPPAPMLNQPIALGMVAREGANWRAYRLYHLGSNVEAEIVALPFVIPPAPSSMADAPAPLSIEAIAFAKTVPNLAGVALPDIGRTQDGGGSLRSRILAWARSDRKCRHPQFLANPSTSGQIVQFPQRRVGS